MRYHWLALAGLLAWSTAGSAQQPQSPQPAAPALDPARDPLDALLVRWEGEMKKINSLWAQCSRTDEDRTFQTTKVFVGQAKYLKPSFAMLEMQRKDKPEEWEKFVCSGTFGYQYVPLNKEVIVYQLPAPKAGQVADDNCLSFIFGMKAEEAKRRYVLTLDPQHGNDPYYIYLNILPRFDQDRQEFQRAQLVLNRDNYLPRRLWFEQPNKNTVLWDIPQIKTNIDMPRAQFVKPDVPDGWKLKQAPRPDQAQPPRIVRPNGQ